VNYILFRRRNNLPEAEQAAMMVKLQGARKGILMAGSTRDWPISVKNQSKFGINWKSVFNT
jgi:hypothetical protein